MKTVARVALAIVILISILVYAAERIADDQNRSDAFRQNYQALEVTSFKAGDTVSHSFPIRGQGNEYWFYSGSMPIQITDPAGRILWQGSAQPDGDEDDTSGPVEFSIQADVGSYTGDAYVSFIQTNTGDGEEYSTTTIPVTVR